MVLADVLGELTPDQQETQSLCDAWTVRRVAGHLIVPMQVGIPRFAVAMMRHRGDFDRANDSLSRAQATRPFDEIVRTLRDKADSRFTPPGQGPEAPLTDIIVHGLDITWPRGLSHTVDAPQAVRALDHVAAGRGRFTSLLDGHRLEASDLDWCHGVVPWCGADRDWSGSGTASRIDRQTRGTGSSEHGVPFRQRRMHKWVSGPPEMGGCRSHDPQSELGMSIQ